MKLKANQKLKIKIKRETLESNNADESKTLNTFDDDDLTFNEYLIAEKPYRYIILIITSLLTFSNSFQWANISSISKDFEKYYKLTTFQTYLFSNLYLIVYVVMLYPSFYLIEKKSLNFAVKKEKIVFLKFF